MRGKGGGGGGGLKTCRQQARSVVAPPWTAVCSAAGVATTTASDFARVSPAHPDPRSAVSCGADENQIINSLLPWLSDEPCTINNLL